MNETGILWLSSVTQIGYVRGKSLLKHFETPENIYMAKTRNLEQLKLHPKLITNIKDAQKISPEELAEKLEAKNIKFLSVFSENYPKALKEIHNPPLVLYIKGEMPDTELSFSIVGARKCTRYGADIAFDLAAELSSYLTIISGMAKGIDGCAHKGALKAGGKTVAVMGCGVDICYPTAHQSLYEEIIAKGAVISEYPPGMQPQAGFFPNRNRIISGLALGVLVVEADFKSGSLITSDWALEQGREVFAVPGNINNVFSQGTNNLIKHGATLVTSAEDILFALEIEVKEADKNNDKKEKTVPLPIEKDAENRTKKEKTAPTAPKEKTASQSAEKDGQTKKEKITPPLAPEEELVYSCIGSEPIDMDSLLSKTNLSLQQLQFALTMLELKNLIERKLGGLFSLK